VLATGSSALAALTVQIIDPATDPFEAVVGQEEDFEAVAFLDGVELEYGVVTWAWDFGDGSDPDTDNPTEHTYTSTANFTVTVTAAYGGLQAQDTIVLNVLPGSIFDSIFYARPAGAEHMGYMGYGGGLAWWGDELCDNIELVWESTDVQYTVYAIKFYQWVDGHWQDEQWVDAAWQEVSELIDPDVKQPRFNGGDGPDYYQAVSPVIHTALEPNRDLRFRVEIRKEHGAPGGPIWTPYWYRENQWSSNNTAVHDGGNGVLLHEQGNSHQVSWDISHCQQYGYCDLLTEEWSWQAPLFGVTIEVCDLSGQVLRTIHVTAPAELGAGSYSWDGKIGEAPNLVDAPDGVYTYRVTADHYGGGDGCNDQDKSPLLEISNVSVSDFEWVDLPTEAQVTLSYRLNRNATNCRVRVFNHDLAEVTVTAPTGGALSNTAGDHSLTVEFEDPNQIVGNYRFVVLADETPTVLADGTAGDGALNPDGQPKPALAKGIALSALPRASLYSYVGYTLPASMATILSRSLDGKHYAASLHEQSLPGNAAGVAASISRDAVFHLYGHGYSGAAIIGMADKPIVLVEKKWTAPGTIERDFRDGVDLAADQHPHTYPNLLLAVLQQCYTAQDAYDIGSATKAAVSLGADAALGFEDLIIMGAPGHTWMETFYDYAIDPAHPARTVGEAAIEAADQVWDEHSKDLVPPGGVWPDPTVGTGASTKRASGPSKVALRCNCLVPA